MRTTNEIVSPSGRAKEGTYKALPLSIEMWLPSGGCVDIDLTDNERERLERYAEALGLSSIEDALTHAARAQLERKYRLPSKQASVVPIRGKKNQSGGNDG